MHEIKCNDCGKHLGWTDLLDNIGELSYCDGCALIHGEERAREFIPTITFDSSENVTTHDIKGRREMRKR